jgi:hypothetical protein
MAFAEVVPPLDIRILFASQFSLKMADFVENASEFDRLARKSLG